MRRVCVLLVPKLLFIEREIIVCTCVSVVPRVGGLSLTGDLRSGFDKAAKPNPTIAYLSARCKNGVTYGGLRRCSFGTVSNRRRKPIR